jgi:hypothetical protein
LKISETFMPLKQGYYPRLDYRVGPQSIKWGFEGLDKMNIGLIGSMKVSGKVLS